MSRLEGDVFLSYKPPEAPDWRKCKKRRRTGEDNEHALAEEPLERETIRSLEEAKSLCWRQAQAVYREVAEEVYGETFAAISTFLEQSRSESSQWGQVLQVLQASASSSSAAASGPPPPAPPSLLSHGGFNCLIPCAIVHPNMSVADRPRLVQLLLDALGRSRRPPSRCASPPALTVTLNPHRHNSLVKIFGAMHEAISREMQRGAPRRASYSATRRGPSASAACTSYHDVLSLYSLLPSSGQSSGPLSGAPVRRRLLLVFTDVEAVDRRLLENLLCLLGERQLQLPVQLLFLVSATCPFSANLGSAATSTLQAATFVLPPCSLCFDKLLTRLFLDRELPVMLSARVLRFLRATFLESHLSIEVFFQHLDLILYLHFRHVSSLLCMLPYNQLKQPAAAPTGRQGDTSGAVKGLGERCLSLNPVFDWSNPHTEKAFLEIDRLLQVPSLQATPIDATPLLTFIRVKKTIRAQVNNRCQAWAAANIMAQSFKILQPGGSLDSSPMHMYELLMDVQRPARWTACEEKLKELIANVSLRELDLLLQAWNAIILTLVPESSSESQPTEACPPPADPAEPLPPPPTSEGDTHISILKPTPTSAASASSSTLPSSSHDPSAAVAPGPIPSAWDASTSSVSKPSSVSPAPVVPVYVCGSATLRLWRAKIDMLCILLPALAKDTRQFQALLKKKGAGEGRAAGVMMGSGFQSKRMALAAKAQQKEGKGEEEKDDIPPELHKRYHEFCVKERGVRNAVIEMLCGVTEHCVTMIRALGPGHEAVWFDDTQELEDHFLAQVRAVTARALGDPQHHLQCRCCKSGEISHTCPDLCIAYTLYEEDPRRNVVVGKMLESFTDITMAGGTRRADEGQSEQLKVRLQHALLGLETMGFVRPYGTRGEWSKIVYSYTVVQQENKEQQDE